MQKCVRNRIINGEEIMRKYRRPPDQFHVQEELRTETKRQRRKRDEEAKHRMEWEYRRLLRFGGQQ